MNNSRVVAAFSCCGKTHFVLNNFKKMSCIDHDIYDWKYRGQLGNNWLNLYNERIVELREKFKFVFVNAIPEVIATLPSDSVIIYPHRSLKIDYHQRALKRNPDSDFFNALYFEWDKWIDTCENWQGDKLILAKGEYLTDHELYFRRFYTGICVA